MSETSKPTSTPLGQMPPPLPPDIVEMWLTVRRGLYVCDKHPGRYEPGCELCRPGATLDTLMARLYFALYGAIE